MSSATPPTATPRISEAIFRGRWVIGGLVLLAVFSFLSAVLRAPTDDVNLSIRNPKGSGAMALAEVLRHQGVLVSDAYSVRDLGSYSSKDTVVITNTNQIDDATLREILHTPTNLLIIGTLAQGKRFDPYVQSVPAGSPKEIKAQCDFPAQRQPAPFLPAVARSVPCASPKPRAFRCRTTLLPMYRLNVPKVSA